MVERQLPKLNVVGSIPITRSNLFKHLATFSTTSERFYPLFILTGEQKLVIEIISFGVQRRVAVLKEYLLNQYKDALSVAEIAAGMNAATRNAKRLLNDAKILLEADRFPSSCSLAILAIEEAGKVSILRELAVADGNDELKAAWRRYRDHREKKCEMDH